MNWCNDAGVGNDFLFTHGLMRSKMSVHCFEEEFVKRETGILLDSLEVVSV